MCQILSFARARSNGVSHWFPCLQSLASAAALCSPGCCASTRLPNSDPLRPFSPTVDAGLIQTVHASGHQSRLRSLLLGPCHPSGFARSRIAQSGLPRRRRRLRSPKAGALTHPPLPQNPRAHYWFVICSRSICVRSSDFFFWRLTSPSPNHLSIVGDACLASSQPVQPFIAFSLRLPPRSSSQ